MLDNISESTTNHSNSQSHHHHQQQQQPTNSNSQITVDFDSILQELKSVGQAHQSEQQTTMIVENITANMKTEPLINTSNETSKSYSSVMLSYEIDFVSYVQLNINRHRMIFLLFFHQILLRHCQVLIQ
jgi:hypothetical protein